MIKRLVKAAALVSVCVVLEYCLVQWLLFSMHEYEDHNERMHEITHRHLLKAHRAPYECLDCATKTELPPPHLVFACSHCNATQPLEIPQLTDRQVNGMRHRTVQNYYAVSPVVLWFECQRETSWWCFPALNLALKATLQCPRIEFHPFVVILSILSLLLPIFCIKTVAKEVDSICHDKFQKQRRLINQEASDTALTNISAALGNIGESPSILPPTALNFTEPAFAAEASRVGLRDRHYASAQVQKT